MSPDQQLMTRIKSEWGAAIDGAIAGTVYDGIPLDKGSYGASMIAAIAANESGGDIHATRFEPKVLGTLVAVFLGKKPSFGAITAKKLVEYLQEVLPADPVKAVGVALDELEELSTSFGPMQIMGYQGLANGYKVSELYSSADTHFKHAVAMLDDFRTRFDIAMGAGPASLFFHCWNAGSPSAPTFDPQYTARGLERMAIYAAL